MRMDDHVWEYMANEGRRRHSSSTSAASPSGHLRELHVYFRIEFFVGNINVLNLPSTRHLYYLQVREVARGAGGGVCVCFRLSSWDLICCCLLSLH